MYDLLTASGIICEEMHFCSCIYSQGVKSVTICSCGSLVEYIPFDTKSILHKTCCLTQVQLIKLSSSGIWRPSSWLDPLDLRYIIIHFHYGDISSAYFLCVWNAQILALFP